MVALSIAFCLLISFLPGDHRCARAAQFEGDRVQQWHENGNTWPPNWQPESEKMRRFYEKRELELHAIPGGQEKWENWLQFTQHRLVPKFTEVGFELITTPPEVHAKLAAAVAEGVRNWDSLGTEGHSDGIYTPPDAPPKMVAIGDLAWEVAEDLKSLHEEWSGLALEATSSYGVRLYQNSSSLIMHYDKVKTHVISSIVHIAHEYDNDDEPWPIQIEDHEGNLHSVSLQPGQMLFYESAKCLHGRMKKFRGKYYGSIFVHYQPVDKSIWNYSHEEVMGRVPPHWRDGVVEEKGSRWAGAGLTVSSRLTEDAPDRIIEGRLHEETNRNQFYPPILHNEL